MHLPELDALIARHAPARLILRHDGLNGWADAIVILRRLCRRLFPRDIALRALAATMRRTNPPPYGFAVHATARGNGCVRRVTLSHADVYAATAEIAVLVARRITEGPTPTAGARFAFEALCDVDAPAALRECRFFATAD